MRYILLFAVLQFSIYSCITDQKPIVNSADYETNHTIKKVNSTYDLNSDIKFWHDRLVRMPNDEASVRKLAGLHAAMFRKTGRIEELQFSDSTYHALIKSSSFGRSGLYLGLAQNAITQHQFKRAEIFADSAIQTGEHKAAALLVSIDIALELGSYQKAKKILKQFTNKNSFAHLIRQVKVKDQEGQLDSAILIMEKAFDRVKGNKELYCWSLSNLGDMYGHAGRIEDAYHAYLSVLQKDNQYDYALKGIAWIALSHDKNYTEAKRLITILSSRSRMPEAHLLLAEIAEEENNTEEKIKQLNLFIRLTDNPAYKTMYAKYLTQTYAEDLNQPQKSLAIAEEEINSRPTPQSFDLKAWALLQMGRKQEALFIAQKYVVNKTFEPDATYHLGIIYLANGFEAEAEKYLEQALESSFELGPATTRKIKNTLLTL